MSRRQGVVVANLFRYGKQAILRFRAYGPPLVSRKRNNNISFDLYDHDDSLQDEGSSLSSFFYWRAPSVRVYFRTVFTFLTAFVVFFPMYFLIFFPTMFLAIFLMFSLRVPVFSPLVLISSLSFLGLLRAYPDFAPLIYAGCIVVDAIESLFLSKPAIAPGKPPDAGLHLRVARATITAQLRDCLLTFGESCVKDEHLEVGLDNGVAGKFGHWSALRSKQIQDLRLLLYKLGGLDPGLISELTPLIEELDCMLTLTDAYSELVTREDPTSPPALSGILSEPSKISRLGDASASITVSAADVVLVARSGRGEVADSGFHIKDPTYLNKSVGYDGTEFSKKWSSSIPLGVLLSRFRIRGTRLTSNKLSKAAQTVMKLPRTSRGLRGRGRFDLATFLLDPMICSPVVRRRQGRIRFILQLASPFFDTLSWGSGPSNWLEFGCPDGSGQAPSSPGHDPTSSAGGAFWSGDGWNVELPTSNFLGSEEGLGTDDIPWLPPEAAVPSTLHDFLSPLIHDRIVLPPPPTPPPDSTALYQYPGAEPHLEGVVSGDSLYEYFTITTPIQRNSMENHGTSTQGHQLVPHSSLLASSGRPLPGPGASNQPQLRPYPAVRPTNPPSTNLPLRELMVYSAHNYHQPHLSGTNATASNNTGAADAIPEQLNLSLNPPTQPDLDPPNQRSYSRGFIDGVKFGMKLAATCTQVNASSVRAGSSKSPNRRVQPMSPPIAPILGLDIASSLPSGHGLPAAAPSVSGEIGPQLYAPAAAPHPTAFPNPGSISGALPGADTNPTVNPQELRQELEPDAQTVGHDRDPPTSQATQSIVLEGAPSTSTRQAPVSPPNPMHSMTNVLQPTPGPSSNSQGKARKSKKCPECNCAFRRPGELRDHIASKHRGKKQHACSFDGCDRTYGTRSNLAKHVKRKHTPGAPTMPETHVG